MHSGLFWVNPVQTNREQKQRTVIFYPDPVQISKSTICFRYQLTSNVLKCHKTSLLSDLSVDQTNFWKSMI